MFVSLHVFLFVFCLYISLTDDRLDIDQLLRIMALTGTPSEFLLEKLGSEEVILFNAFW